MTFVFGCQESADKMPRNTSLMVIFSEDKMKIFIIQSKIASEIFPSNIYPIIQILMEIIH